MSFLQKPIFLPILFLLGIVSGFYIHEVSLASYGSIPNSGYVSGVTNITSGKDVFSSEKINAAKKIIETQYYHFSEKSKEEIENGMIESMVRSLGDKHSSYFPPKEAEEFKNLLSGDFEGIGAIIDNDVHGIKIKKVFPTSPAQKAGLQDGDIITRVGNISME